MPVGEPDKDECPVDARPGEREIHGGISPARQATQDCEAQAARRASEHARRRSLHYVEPIFRAQRRRRGQIRGRSR
jgi:hypothetical protein